MNVKPSETNGGMMPVETVTFSDDGPASVFREVEKPAEYVERR